MPDQPWDPKWPQTQDHWEVYYPLAGAKVSVAGSAWETAFKAIIEADRAGDFNHLRSLHAGVNESPRVWIWRRELWDNHCIPIFNQPLSGYVKLVYCAVPPAWVTGGLGEVDGIPKPWHTGPAQDERKVWAFRATVTLIAGLVEGKLPQPT